MQPKLGTYMQCTLPQKCKKMAFNLFFFPSHKMTVQIVNPVKLNYMEVWLGVENPAGTVYKYRIDHLFPVSLPPHLSDDMRGDL